MPEENLDEKMEKEDMSSYKTGAFDYLTAGIGGLFGGYSGYKFYESASLGSLAVGVGLSTGLGALLFTAANVVGMGYAGYQAGKIVYEATIGKKKKVKKEKEEQEKQGQEEAQKNAYMQQLAAMQGQQGGS